MRAIFYPHFGCSRGRVKLGHIEPWLEKLAGARDAFVVRIELGEAQ